jgi:hypothetical protein
VSEDAGIESRTVPTLATRLDLIHSQWAKRPDPDPVQILRIRFRPGHIIPDPTGSISTTLNFIYLHLFEIVYFADTMRDGFSASRQVIFFSS